MRIFHLDFVKFLVKFVAWIDIINTFCISISFC